jgi:hypothetical protein
MTEIETWIEEHKNLSRDYADLIMRAKLGEQVDCVLSFSGIMMLAQTGYVKTGWGELFNIVAKNAVFNHSTEDCFLAFCDNTDLLFVGQNFLEKTRKLLEIAKNAAEFAPIFVPLNTVEDVNAILALINPEQAKCD